MQTFILLCGLAADKQTQVSSEEYGRDLSAVQILITKEVCFQIALLMSTSYMVGWWIIMAKYGLHV